MLKTAYVVIAVIALANAPKYAPDKLTADFLLNEPVGTPFKAVPGPPHISLMAGIRIRTVELELISEQSAKWLSEDPERFQGDLDMLRGYRRELDDAPRLWEASRFPKWDECQRGMTLNQGFRDHIIKRMEFEVDRTSLFERVLEETAELGQIWDAARDVSGTYYSPTMKRRALKKLRDSLSEEYFKQGRLPYPVPLHRFEELKLPF